MIGGSISALMHARREAHGIFLVPYHAYMLACMLEKATLQKSSHKHHNASTVEASKASYMDAMSSDCIESHRHLDKTNAMPTDEFKDPSITVLDESYPQQAQSTRREERS